MTHLASRVFSPRHISPSFRETEKKFKNEVLPSLSISRDWFAGHIPRWLTVFDDYRFAKRPQLNALEIGSWEGLSAYFLLHTLPNATLTCIDTWEGGDEHKAGFQNEPNTTEQFFDKNLAPFRDRLVKYKGTSFSFFTPHTLHNKFDFIYVDGSHYADDVIVDAVKCFELLKVGGVMIFDDYFWNFYPNTRDNPASAINLFLRLKRGSYKLVDVDQQVIIEKTFGRP